MRLRAEPGQRCAPEIARMASLSGLAVVYLAGGGRQTGETHAQSSTSARPASAFNAAPVVATIVGIPAAAIVLAALAGTSLPIVGSGRGALIGL